MNELKDFEALANAFSDVARQMERGDVRRASKKGANIVLAAVKAGAPSDTGTLRSGLILHLEKSRVKGKVVYDVYPDPKMNAIFQKPIKNPVRSKGKYGYYPASQEYGFFTRRADGGLEYTRSDGQVARMDKVPGKHYMRLGADAAESAARKAILDSILEDIEKAF